MNVEETAVIVYLVMRKKKKRNARKKYWVHPLLRERQSKGLFYTYYFDIKNYEAKFFNYMRMSRSTFHHLLDGIKTKISGSNSRFRQCISPEEKLVITVRYLATGCSFAHISHDFRIGLTTTGEIVSDVCQAIWENIKPIAIPPLTRDKWNEVAEGFKKNAQFPNCIGAVDGKHIKVKSPEHSGSLYFNYKHFFSIVLLAICDADYKFIYIDVGAYGKCSDSYIFKDLFFMIDL
nr:protein ANTAGONIST OF LIKE HETEROCHROMATIN PROTEIN 1-like [Onthophagus taurus]